MTEQHVLIAYNEFVPWKTHGRRPVTTAARLMKEYRTMFGYDFGNEFERCWGC